MLIWLIGISGAGKTTLGLRLINYFESKGMQSYLLDGDEVRSVFDGDLGYSRKDREANIKRIILAGYVLDRCDIATVVCNISPFQHLRDLARAKIGGYNEVYLKKELSVSMENDVKGVYAESRGKSDLIGLEIGFDEPCRPDLVIEVDKESVDDSFEKIVRYIKEKETC